MCGLSHTDANQDYTSIEFGLLPGADGNIYVYESGTQRGIFGSYATGDVFRVSIEGGVVKYRKNGAVLYTSTITPAYPLLVDTALYTNNSTLTNVVINHNTGSGGSQSVSWTNASGVSSATSSLTKTAADGWGNAGAASTQTISSGDGYVELTATETNTWRMCGLSHTDTNQDYTTIDFGLLEGADGNLWVFESGVQRGTFGAYATGDDLRVSIESGVVKYKKNGTVIYTSTVAPSYPLLVDTSLNTAGSTLSNVLISSGGGSSSANIHWLVSDQLGTPRMIFDQSGSFANVSRHDYLPFGEELVTGQGLRSSLQGYSANDYVRQHFTGQERDNETGLDYMHARYYANVTGRFTSSDTLFGSLGNPQTLNRYSYVGNNPLNFSDPTGHTAFDASSNAFAEIMGQGGYAQPKKPTEPTVDPADIISIYTNADKNTGKPLSPGEVYTRLNESWAEQLKQQAVLRGQSAVQRVRSLFTQGTEYARSAVSFVRSNIRLPDFYQTEFDIPIDPEAPLIGIALQATVDRHGTVYLGGGGYIGEPGVNTTAGYLTKTNSFAPTLTKPSNAETRDFITGLSAGGAAEIGPVTVGGTNNSELGTIDFLGRILNH